MPACPVPVPALMVIVVPFVTTIDVVASRIRLESSPDDGRRPRRNRLAVVDVAVVLLVVLEPDRADERLIGVAVTGDATGEFGGPLVRVAEISSADKLRREEVINLSNPTDKL